MLKIRLYISLTAVLGVLIVSLLSVANLPQAKPAQNHKIYECLEVTSSTEDLIKHLKEQDSLVDQFVLLEDQAKSGGKENEWQYPHLKTKLGAFEDKIIYIAMPKLPEAQDLSNREFFLKNQFLKALDGCSESDLVIFANLNTKIKPEKLYKAMVQLEQKPNDVLVIESKPVNHGMLAQLAYVTTYHHVKQELPVPLKKCDHPKQKLSDWQLFFFPTIPIKGSKQ